MAAAASARACVTVRSSRPAPPRKISRMMVDLLLAVLAVALALGLRPWRATGAGGPPWPWLACCAGLPVFWGADLLADSAIIQPLSGASLLVLLAGWPLAVLGLLPVAGVMVVVGGLPWDDALHRLVWLGIVPGTLAMLLGAGVRRWLPGHLFIYILGRGFFTIDSSIWVAQIIGFPALNTKSLKTHTYLLLL